MAYVQKSVEQQKAESDRIEKMMNEASVKATKERAAKGELTPRQISNVKRMKRYSPKDREEILSSQRRASSKSVVIEGTYKTQEDAAKSSAEISKHKDIHSTYVIKKGSGYAIKGKYTGPMKNVKVTKDWRQQAARDLETKGSTVIAGKKFTKEELMPTSTKTVLKKGEKEITPDVAYDAGLISKRDYERSKTLEGSYVIVQEGSVKQAKELQARWKGKLADPAPGQRGIDKILWAEENVPYMAEDEATRKTIKTVSKGMTAKDIKELREPTFGEKLIQRTRDVRKVQGENVFQWMGEGVVEYGGAVLHGGEMLLRPAGRKAIGNVVFDVPTKEDRGNIFEVASGAKHGSLLQQAAVASAKDIHTQITTRPVEFGVKTATVLALSYGVSKGVGTVKAARTPITHSVGRSQVAIAPKGEIAIGKSAVATMVGKAGKQGTYMTRISSVFKKTGEGIVHGQKVTHTKGAHVLKTQTKPGGKVLSSKGVTYDVATKTGKTTAQSKQAGVMSQGKKLTGTVGRYKHKTLFDVEFAQPKVMQFGDKWIHVVGKSDVATYGKSIALKATKGSKLSVKSKGDILSRTEMLHLGGTGGSSGGAGPVTMFKSKLGTGGAVSAGAIELAKKSAESIAKQSIVKQSKAPPVVSLPTAPRVRTAPTSLSIKIESPAKLILGPETKKKGQQPILDAEAILKQGQRQRVSTSTATLDSVIQKTRPDIGKSVFSNMDIKSAGSLDRVIPAIVTPQAVTGRMAQRQTETLLFGTVTGSRTRVGHPTPVPQTLLPGSFRPATISPMAGMSLEAPLKKKKKKPLPWWAGLHIHPVKSPAELFGLPTAAKKRRKRK